MLSRPEPQSFTRFFVSLGAFLCIAAFIAPALVLRETKILQISRADLESFTPTAKEEIERRQRIARRVGGLVPYGGILMLIGGIGVLYYATPRLRRQEDAEDARAAAELRKLNAELSPQSQSDLEESARDEAATELAAEVRAAEPTATPPVISPAAVGNRAQRYREIEERVLSRVGEITPVSYDFRAHVKVATVDGSEPLRLDGVMRSRHKAQPDLVLEIKLTSASSFRNNLRNRVDEAIARLIRYRRRADANAQLWLIMVTDEAIPESASRRLREVRAEFGDLISISLVTDDQIDTLAMPLATGKG